LASAWLGKRRHAEAIAEARKAISYDPNFAEAHVCLAEILSMAGEPAEAIPLIEQAMRLNPRYTPNYLWALGHAHWMLGNNEESIRLMKRAVTRNPDHLVAHLLLVSCYVETGREEAARLEAGEVLRISPDYSIDLARTRMPYKNTQMRERVLENLRKAGMA
jgi:adenylate cyclase